MLASQQLKQDQAQRSYKKILDGIQKMSMNESAKAEEQAIKQRMNEIE